ncbi:MAG: hypothetical protein H6607_00065 [Flavobacteriales bacterium]|nr:hypothetical protein [Flavobacteriales bacterium]
MVKPIFYILLAIFFFTGCDFQKNKNVQNNINEQTQFIISYFELEIGDSGKMYLEGKLKNLNELQMEMQKSLKTNGKKMVIYLRHDEQMSYYNYNQFYQELDKIFKELETKFQAEIMLTGEYQYTIICR